MAALESAVEFSTAPAAQREADRLAALERYDVFDTPPEEAFDCLTRIVRRSLGVSMATVTFLDGHRQWFKSRQGLDNSQTPRGPAFCNVPTATGRPLIVEDASRDPRFSANPLVTGDPHIRFYAGYPLVTPDGHTIATLCAMDTAPRTLDDDGAALMQDLARLAMGEMNLRLEASTDALTSLLSRRSFRQQTERAIGLAFRHRHDLACVSFDVDHFKAINDERGHPVGDRVLMEIAERNRKLLRSTDLLGRMGGEEFSVILPHTGRVEALEVAEKLRRAIEALPFLDGGTTFNVTASFGVAMLGRAAPDFDTLLSQADQALYAAKHAGRNRVHGFAGAQQEEASAQGRRVLKAGLIVFNGGHSVIDCTVRRLSDEGATVEVITAAGVPDRFKLRIEADDFSRICNVTTKSDRRIELRFG